MPHLCSWWQGTLAAGLLILAGCSSTLGGIDSAENKFLHQHATHASFDADAPPSRGINLSGTGQAAAASDAQNEGAQDKGNQDEENQGKGDQSKGDQSKGATQTNDQDWSGVRLRLLTMDSPQIQSAFRYRAQEFERLTGAEIELVTLPFGELHDAIISDAQAPSPTYDIVTFVSQWLHDYAATGYLQDLSQAIEQDQQIRWHDIMPFYREFVADYGGKPYAIPVDGDFLLVFYRIDLLQRAHLNPPSTWDEYLAVARTFHNQDFNQDGTPDYGSCIAKQPSSTSFWMLWGLASPMIQTQGTGQGAFFDPNTLEPLVQNAAMAKAFDMYRATGLYGPPAELSMDLAATRSLFMGGRCALTLDWADPGTLALSPEYEALRDQVGAVIMPGSRQVLDRMTRTLVPCDKIRCPYAIDGVNYAPYAAAGGWAAGITAASDPQQRAAAYDFLSYVSQPQQSNQDVTLGSTGFNPYRLSQFQRTAWLEAGMSPEMASKYLGALELSLSSPNIVLDLRIPQAQRYQQDVLDQILAEFLRGSLSADESLDKLYDGWSQVTEKADLAQQRRAYRLSLGLMPPDASELLVP